MFFVQCIGIFKNMYYDFTQYTDTINGARMLLPVVFIQHVKLIILQNYICIY